MVAGAACDGELPSKYQVSVQHKPIRITGSRYNCHTRMLIVDVVLFCFYFNTVLRSQASQEVTEGWLCTFKVHAHPPTVWVKDAVNLPVGLTDPLINP